MSLPAETRIYNSCVDNGVFGRQMIQVSQKSFNKWPEPAGKVSFTNKYIFSESIIEGKKFYVFSKPFDFPFKVADLIYITSTSKKYCFKDAPEEIENEISLLSQENLLIKNCPENSVEVCFRNFGCDIDINYEGKWIKKDRDKIYFEGDALMYAGIFADKEIYECQLKRLMQRVDNLALLYKDKAEFVTQAGCNSNLELVQLSTFAHNLENSADLSTLSSTMESIKKGNDNLGGCKLW
jgi:hypothetical protein